MILSQMQRSTSHSITKFDSRQSSASQPGTQVSDWFRETNDNQEIVIPGISLFQALGIALTK